MDNELSGQIIEENADSAEETAGPAAEISVSSGQKETISVPFIPDEEEPYIFISYSHADRERIFPIIKRLYEKGWRVWYDEGLELGKNWRSELERHIRGCEVFLLFLTVASANSKDVAENELVLASQNGKRIVICKLDEDAEFSSEEAQDIMSAIEYAAASHDLNPRTDEQGLEETLEGIEELERLNPRTAEGRVITKNPSIVFSDSNSDYNIEIIEDGNVRFSNYSGSEKVVQIPKEYNGHPVVELVYLFRQNNAVETVHIPPTVRTIGPNTFCNCKNLRHIYIPASVTEIMPRALFAIKKCKVHCAEGSAAQAYAEKRSNLTVVIDPDLDIAETVSEPVIDKYAFCSRASDRSAEVDEIIRHLEDNDCYIVSDDQLSGNELLDVIMKADCFIAFVTRGYMEENTVAQLKTAIGLGKKYIIYIMEECELPHELGASLDSIMQLRYDNGTEEDRINKLIDWLNRNGCKKVSIAIPNYNYSADKEQGITITKYTGSEEDVVIPESRDGCNVTGIGSKAFYECPGLVSVSIPETVAKIGRYAFGACGNLRDITVSPDNSRFMSEGGILFTKDGKKLVAYPAGRSGGYEIPADVRTVGDNSFNGCGGLVSVSIPDGVKRIENNAFFKCAGLASVTVPDSVDSIGPYAFYGCAGLVSAALPENLTLISERLFSGCANLAEVNIPDSVTKIGNFAFYGCGSLASVTIPAGVSAIGNNAFNGCGALTSVVIPESVRNISASAFYKCANLNSVIIEGANTSIGDQAFSGCGDLTVFCHESSAPWAYCEKHNIPHKPIEQPAEDDAAEAESPEFTEPAEAAETLETAEPAEAAEPAETAEPAEVTEPAETAEPTEAAEPAEVLENTEAAEPAGTAEPAEKPAKAKKSRGALIALLILLALLLAAAGVQFSGLYDIIGWLLGLLG